MRIAYFSPMPPARTGIATYSRELVLALRRRCDVTVFTHTADAEPVERVEIVDFFRDPRRLKSVLGFDRVLYHVGNNPWYHLEIFKALTIIPGAVCLHDLVIYYLAAGLGKGAVIKELLLENRATAFADLARIESEAPEGDLLRFAGASRHPCVRGLLEITRHVIVHNETSARALRAIGYGGRVDVIPLLHYSGEADVEPSEALRMREELGYGKADVVLGAFGFIGPTKRLDKVLEAMASLRRRGSAGALRLLIVGEGVEALQEQIRALGLEPFVATTGFVDEARFRSYLSVVDAVVNLRHPSHGESSASLIQAMLLARPCLVTDDAWFAELPDDTVIKVGYSDSEVEEIAQAMDRFVRDPESCRTMGLAGQAFIREHHAPDVVAARFIEALAAFDPRASVRPQAAQEPGVPHEQFSPAAFLEGRARKLIP
jgi:glycosyltransferase involved in cell wall biosynthesis